MSSETISKAELIEHIRRAFVEPFPQGEVLYVHGIQDYIEKADWVDGPSAEASCWTKEMHEMLVGIIGKSWQELDPRKLPHGSCLTFWSARGAAYYLPSVLLACLEDIEHNNGKAGELIDYLDKYILDDLYEILDEEGKKIQNQFKGFLSNEQKRVVRDFLRYYELPKGQCLGKDPATYSLQHSWKIEEPDA